MATRDYTLGKGKVLFKPTGATAYVDLGNAPAFQISLSIDKLEHLSSRAGLSVKDLEVITKMGMAGSFTLDEPNAENLRMFVMSADADASTQAAAALGSIDSIVLPAADALGKWYPFTSSLSNQKTIGAVAAGTNNLGTAVVVTVSDTQTANATYEWTIVCSSAGNVKTRRAGQAWSAEIPVTDATDFNILDGVADSGLDAQIDDVSNLAVGDEFTFTVTYTLTQSTRIYNIEATDVLTDSVTVNVGATQMIEGIEGVGNYQVDRKAGLVYINIDQDTPANGIADGDTLTIQVKKLDGAKTTSLGATTTAMKGDLYFVGDPPQGRIIDIQGFCSLTPNGDFALIGTDWMQMQFNVEFLQVAGIDGLIKVEDRGKVDV